MGQEEEEEEEEVKLCEENHPYQECCPGSMGHTSHWLFPATGPVMWRNVSK